MELEAQNLMPMSLFFLVFFFTCHFAHDSEIVLSAFIPEYMFIFRPTIYFATLQINVIQYHILISDIISCFYNKFYMLSEDKTLLLEYIVKVSSIH